MRSQCTAWFLLLIGLLWLARAAQAQPSPAKSLILFSAQEAEQLRFPEGLEQQVSIRTRGLSLGPHIIIQNPQVKETSTGHIIETATPMDLFVAFEANGAPVDMNSLHAQVMKGIFTKSLTSLLQPYIHGTALQAKQVQIPQGRFLITIEIADVNGAKTVETYHLEVKAR